MDDDLETAIDAIDTLLFESAFFHDGEHRRHLRRAMEKWEQELDALNRADQNSEEWLS